jgi:phenylacetic acid degradation protein
LIYAFKNIIPVVDSTSFVHPQATVIGNVIIGKHCYIGPSAVLRGDWGQIVIEDGCNVQENCTIHMFPGVTVLLQAGAHIGHNAVIHGASIGKNVLIGMGAIIMDNAIINDESIVGALSFVKADEVFEPRSVIVGNPAKAIKKVTDEMLQWKTEDTKLYQQLPAQMEADLVETIALTEMPKDRVVQYPTYKTWNNTKQQ